MFLNGTLIIKDIAKSSKSSENKPKECGWKWMFLLIFTQLAESPSIFLGRLKGTLPVSRVLDLNNSFNYLWEIFQLEMQNSYQIK